MVPSEWYLKELTSKTNNFFYLIIKRTGKRKELNVIGRLFSLMMRVVTCKFDFLQSARCLGKSLELKFHTIISSRHKLCLECFKWGYMCGSLRGEYAIEKELNLEVFSKKPTKQVKLTLNQHFYHYSVQQAIHKVWKAGSGFGQRFSYCKPHLQLSRTCITYLSRKTCAFLLTHKHFVHLTIVIDRLSQIQVNHDIYVRLHVYNYIYNILIYT